MAHMANHGAVGFIEGLSSGGTNHRIRLCNTDGNHTIGVPHGNRSQSLRQHMKNRACARILRAEPVPAPEVIQHPPLCSLSLGPVWHGVGNVRVRRQRCHRARPAESPFLRRNPVAADNIPIHTERRHGDERPGLWIVSDRRALGSSEIVKPQISGTNRVGENLHRAGAPFIRQFARECVAVLPNLYPIAKEHQPERPIGPAKPYIVMTRSS